MWPAGKTLSIGGGDIGLHRTNKFFLTRNLLMVTLHVLFWGLGLWGWVHMAGGLDSPVHVPTPPARPHTRLHARARASCAHMRITRIMREATWHFWRHRRVWICRCSDRTAKIQSSL